MGMTIDDCIHKLDFSIGAYQKLIDENVSNGEVVGTGVRGTWTASTSLNKAYSDMIEALQTAKDTMRKYQKITKILNSASYTENGTVYSYTYDEDTRVKHIREVIKDGKID